MKKFLSMMLALVMCLSLVPSAFAAETAAADKPAEVAATEDIFARFILDDPKLISSFKFDDKAAWESNIGYMLKHGLSELDLTIDYTDASYDWQDWTVPSNAGGKYAYLCHEVGMSNLAPHKCGIQSITLTICRTEDEWSVTALSKAAEVHDALWASGKIIDTMTQKEKARVYYDWLIANCEYGEYEYDLSGHEDGYTCMAGYAAGAWPVFVSGKGVCGNYAMAYNLLLRSEGIDCTDVVSWLGSHEWTAATLDGVLYHIDATYGDTTGQPNKYFCMTEEAAWARFGGIEKEQELSKFFDDMWEGLGFDPSDFGFGW